MMSSVVRSCLVTALVAVAASAPVHAQEQAVGEAVDSFLVLVPVRPSGAVAQELTQVTDALSRAKLERSQADLLERSVEARLQALKAEIDGIKQKADAAKKAKDAAAQATAEADKKAAEARKANMERRRDLRKAEIDLAAARENYANAAIKALQLEQALQQRREERAAVMAGPSLASAQQDNALSILENQVLEAQKQAADRNVDVASREKQVIERRISLFKTRVF